MGEKIALGFHTCVDYELDWDLSVIEGLIRKFDVRRSEIRSDIMIDSERALLIVCLAYMIVGTGGEIIPERPDCLTFSSNSFCLFSNSCIFLFCSSRRLVKPE